MSNTYFQFKQFTVHQDLCGMKVSTDACLFGAWVNRCLRNQASPPAKILDIGTGTGLLSLMLAQETTAVIDAVDIDPGAAEQASANFAQSPWHERLNLFQADILTFQPPHLYDTIISNPPFYEQDLKSGDAQKDAAKHDLTLRLDQLLKVAQLHLDEQGVLALLLPYHRLDHCLHLAGSRAFYLKHQLCIQHSLSHPFTRVVLLFSKQPCSPAFASLTIKEQSGSYTEDFVKLLKNYYLRL